MTQANQAHPVSPEIVQLEEKRAAVLHVSGAASELPTLLPEAFEATMRQIADSGAQVAGPPFARYLSFGARIDAEVGFPYLGSLVENDRVRGVTLPAGRAVLATHVGPYEERGAAWARIQAWIREHGLTPTSAPWEAYLTGPDDPGQPVTQIVFPVG
ncbi:MAG TPA: GyrI-like domain-containing protein [Candidatus Binatus sp.]|nr:GyrI-like domain-containing protein [Candidatus Binatus sp.]